MISGTLNSAILTIKPFAKRLKGKIINVLPTIKQVLLKLGSGDFIRNYAWNNFSFKVDEILKKSLQLVAFLFAPLVKPRYSILR